MRLVTWTDSNGYTKRSLVRDCDLDSDATTRGIPNDPPDLERLDWLGVAALGVDVIRFKRELHNRLSEMSLITWRDVQRSQNGVTRAILGVGRDRRLLDLLKRQLIMLYKTG